MKILITGIAGFVGSSLARAVIAKYPGTEITGIDDLSFGYMERLDDISDKINLIIGDLKNVEDLLGTTRFDGIIHCAAIAPLPECQINSYRAIEQNVAICGAIADYALKTGSRDIIFFSSGAIYEGVNTFPTNEDVSIETRLVYPTTKHMAELYFHAMTRSHSLNVVSLRLFNLYGPHQDYFRKQPPLIGYAIKNLLENTEATLYSDGEQKRDYLYIDDLLDLVTKALSKLNNLNCGGNYFAVNAGSGESVSVNQIIAKLETVSKNKLAVKREPATRYWDKYESLFKREIVLKPETIEQEVNKNTLASTDYAYKEFGWKTEVPLEEGLRQCLNYAKSIIKGA